MAQYSYQNPWEEKEICIKKLNTGDESLGIVIAGGTDKPYVHRQFKLIIITDILKDGLAYKDQQLKLYDIILSVNGGYLTNARQKVAVKALRTSGEEIKLLIRRLSPPNPEWIELKYEGDPGFSIAGGLGSEYMSNDHGIFIRNVDKELTKDKIVEGDRLLQIESLHNIYDLRFVTLKIAKSYLDSACKESKKKIKLHVSRTRPHYPNSSSV